MSSAMYPQGLKSPNNYINQGGYKTWKDDGLFRIPTALTAGNVRPLTNKDYSNLDVYKIGSIRPIRHYRRGFRDTKTANTSLLLSQIQDTPGQYVMQDQSNLPCTGIQFVSSYTPQTSLTNNPTPHTVTAQQKATRMVRSATTNISKNYYTTHAQYMQNRCQTYEQKIFNFAEQSPGGKPGSPEALSNTYYAQCYPNDAKACKQVIYKPNNYKYATQGGVSSSARTYRLAVDMAKRR